jgi:hypothetical protein
LEYELFEFEPQQMLDIFKYSHFGSMSQCSVLFAFSCISSIDCQLLRIPILTHTSQNCRVYPGQFRRFQR